MTELEKMKRAKMYLDKMAMGIDPISGLQIPENDTLNNVRIIRCLMYVSEVLGKVISNDGIIQPPHKSRFYISQEELNAFFFSETPIPVSEITNRINQLIDINLMTKLSHQKITKYLLSEGYLEEIETLNGKKRKKPTRKGEETGISSEVRVGMYGPYEVVLYDAAAQHFIIDHMQEILKYNDEKID